MESRPLKVYSCGLQLVQSQGDEAVNVTTRGHEQCESWLPDHRWLRHRNVPRTTQIYAKYATCSLSRDDLECWGAQYEKLSLDDDVWRCPYKSSNPGPTAATKAVLAGQFHEPLAKHLYIANLRNSWGKLCGQNR